MESNRITLGDTPHPRRVLILLIATVVFVAILPLARSIPILVEIVQATVVVSAILVAAATRRALVIGLALGIPTLVMSIVAPRTVSQSTTYAFLVLNSALYVYVVVLMLNRIFATRRVTKETIFMAMASYMLVALVWSFAYIVLEIAYPGSFSLPADLEVSEFWPDLYYFSFVTMTTLGYGDITPQVPAARSLATLEAVSGVMFLAVLIGRLVGAYEADKNVDRD
jgi:hypothetical protein